MVTAHSILLVEDDPDDQMFFTDAVHRIYNKIDCQVANNGKEALKMLEQFKFDLIFMDINMPYMNGFECLEIIKKTESLAKIPVIMLSTSQHPQHIQRSRDLGAAMYCVKPSSFDGLFKELRHILTRGITFHVS